MNSCSLSQWIYAALGPTHTIKPQQTGYTQAQSESFKMAKTRSTLSAQQKLFIVVEALRKHQLWSQRCQKHGVPLSPVMLCKKQGMKGVKSVSEQRTTNSIHD